MGHFGIITPPVPGHINPFSALGRELQSRGHRVTLFHMADLEARVRAEGLDFCAIGASDHPMGSLPESLAQLGRLKGLDALRFTIRAVAKTSAMVCRDAPAAMRAAGVTALLVDQMEAAGATVAEHIGLPFVTVCNALPLNAEPAVPPPFSPWGYQNSVLACIRNQIGYAVSRRVTSPVDSLIADQRRKWNLPPHRSTEEGYSRLAQICQMPEEFDFPRSNRLMGFHYVGPIRRASDAPVPFPWDRLDGRPLIYASLGTLQNSRAPVFRCFAEACRGLPVQLVLSHGGGLTPDQARELPGNPLVVQYAPQVDLLARASLTITHAGLNTVLDSLTNGVPLIAVPITYEQPAIARRVEWTGTGQTIGFGKLRSDRLRRAIVEVLERPTYRSAALKIAEGIKRAGGVGRAADLLETAITRS